MHAYCIQLSRTTQIILNYKGIMEQQRQESSILLPMESLNVEEPPQESDNFGRHSSAGKNDQASDVEDLRYIMEKIRLKKLRE